MRVHRPAAAGAPVFGFVHGGGWVTGGPADVDPLAEVLVTDGWLVASFGYRLAPEHRHPTQVEDVAAGLAALLERLPELGGDPDRLVLGGWSGGGLVASLLTLDARWLAPHGVDPALIRGLVGLSGVYDLRRTSGTRWMRERWIEPTFGPDPAAWHEASPVTHVHPGAPPTWLNNAEIDWGMQREAATFEAALRAVGTPVERTVTPDTHHLSVMARLGAPGDLTTARLRAFLARTVA